MSDKPTVEVEMPDGTKKQWPAHYGDPAWMGTLVPDEMPGYTIVSTVDGRLWAVREDEHRPAEPSNVVAPECWNGCQYAKDIAMPEYSCADECVYLNKGGSNVPA